MSALANLYVFLLVQTAAVSLVIFLYSLFNRRVRLSSLFALWSLMPLLWVLSNLFGAASATAEEARFFLVNLRYSVIVLTPPLTLVFAQRYGGYAQRVSRSTIALLNVLPVIAIFLLFSPYQSLVLTDPRIEMVGTYWFYFGESPQPLFWVFALWGMALMGLAAFFLLRQVWKGFHSQRGLRIMLFIGTLAPAVGAVLNLTWASTTRLPDLAALSFILFTPMWAWAIFRSQAIHVAPISRDALIDNMDDGVFVLDTGSIIVEANDAAASILSLGRSELVGRSFSAVFVDHSDLLHQFDSHEEFQTEVSLTGADEALYYDVKCSELIDDVGMRAGRMIVMRDVTRRKQDQELLAELLWRSERRAQEAETLRQASAAVVSTLDMSETIDLVLEQLNKVVPYTSAAVQLLRDGYLEIVGGRGFRDDYQVVGLRFSTSRGRESGPELHVFQSRKVHIFPDAQEVFPDFRVPPHNHIHGWMGVPLLLHDELIGVITIDSSQIDAFSDEDAHLALAFADQIALGLSNARLFEQVRMLAELDPLTGLYNRRHFFELFSGIYSDLSDREGCLAVMMIDLDFFKRVNDQHGHTIGDQVLIGLANYLKAQLRSNDVVARFGGEEFIVLLPEIDEAVAMRIADRLRREIEATPFETDRGAVPVTISVGLETHDFADDDFLSIDQIVDRADLALLAAKNAGRNQVREFVA